MSKGKLPDRETVEKLKASFTPGTRVELVSMDDPYTQLKPGERGTVQSVDDIGTIFVHWDCGSYLGVAYCADRVQKIPIIPQDVRRQIMAVRDTAQTNMFVWLEVLGLAAMFGFGELVEWLPDNLSAYSAFILTGKSEPEPTPNMDI